MKRVAAGVLAFVVLCSCDIAFSTVGSWSQVKGPPNAVQGRYVMALPDGRVGVFGGTLPSGQPSFETDLYDPTTGSWTKGAPMPGPAFPDVVIVLRDGTVLVAGGRDIDGNLQGATWLYDPTSNTWSQAGSINLPRAFPSAAILSDGRLMIAGGGMPVLNTSTSEVDYNPTSSVEIYDPATRKWSTAGQLTLARNGISLVALGGGGAIAAGGCQGAAGWSPPSYTAEVYDPVANTWSLTTPMPGNVCGADGVALRDGRALIIDQYTFTGVERYFFTSTNNAYVYDPMTRAWSLNAGLASGGRGALLLSDGKVMVPELQQGPIKGRSFKQLVGGQIFDPATNQWTYVSTTSLMMPLAFMINGGVPAVLAMPDGSALVILETDALAFHPEQAPPTTQILDSTGLTFELGAAALVIVLLMLLAYRRASRTDPMKLA